MNKIDEYKSNINYDVWEDIYNMGDRTMPRESRSEYIIRKMREGRGSSPEEIKISRARNLYDSQEGRMNTHPWEDLDEVRSENAILRDNVKELQEQLQNAYKRIAELRTTVELAVEIQKEKQMELNFDA